MKESPPRLASPGGWLLALVATGVVSVGAALPPLQVSNGPPALPPVAGKAAPTDLAIAGSGWFMVRDPLTRETFVTRHGEFRLDDAGSLTSWDGAVVQGYQDDSFSSIGNLVIDATGAPTLAPMSSIQISSNGLIHVRLSDGNEFVRGQLLLRSIQHPEHLQRIQPRVYRITPESLASERPLPPGNEGLGWVQSGALNQEPEEVRLQAYPAAAQAGPLAQGMLTRTGQPTDVGITGPGFFLLRDPNTSELFVTRAGMFLIDGAGYLISYNRRRVQGWADATGATKGDIRIDDQGDPFPSSSGFIRGVSVERDGRIRLSTGSGIDFVRGRVLLAQASKPGVLREAGMGQYGGVQEAGLTLREFSGRIGVEDLRAGTVELVNVPYDLLAARWRLHLWSQGPLMRTSRPTDLALTSGGYFVVRNPVTGERLALRQGQFQMDGDHLVALGSLRVQGFTDSTFTAIGDIVINATGGPTGADTATGTRPRLTSYSIAKDGSIYVTLPDGTAFVRGQVLVQRFREAFLLKELAPGVFGNLDAASPLGDPTGPGTQGTGQIQNGALELLPQRENLLPPSRSALRLRITGEPGRNWIIQATSDFKNWERVGLITSAAGEMEFAEPFQQSTPQRFFRVLVTGP